MPRKVSLPRPTGERKCCFCGLKDDNELEYGKFHEYNGIITHYYCLLFSSNMQQKGLDDEGILGFLPGDINKELKRGRRLPCCYCKKTGATLGCCNMKCKKIFHFPCGLKAGSLHQYFGEFRSYCLHHRPKQIIDKRVLQEIKQCDTRVCYICYDEVNPRDSLGTIWAPCCKKNAWFHRTCVQQLAMSAGYFFKCPLCNNKAEFQRAMLDHGIFIPSQDASWELVPNAFQELLYRHNRCDAEKCMCPKGREYTSTNAKWELTLCRTCGSQGIHMGCGNLKWAEPMWECNECTTILNKSMVTESSDVSRLIDMARESRDDGSSTSDSDISVGGYPEIPMETTVTMSLVSESSSYTRRPIFRTEEQKDERNNYPTCTKVPLRSVYNGMTQTRVPTETQLSNEELPPLTKKPKIVSCSLIDGENRRGRSEDSDDDVIVVSGPSRKETSRSFDEKRWVPTDARRDKPSVEITIENVKDLEIRRLPPKVIENDSGIGSTNAQGRSTGTGIASRLERLPIEIDLSDCESVSTTSITVNPEPITNVVPDIPELNIQISNVTSLSPEVFASVPDIVDQSLNDSTTNRTVQGQASDERPVVKPKIIESSLPQLPREGLQILRLEGASDPSNPNKPIFYGLAIPGTNTVVPLIIASPDSRSSHNVSTSKDPRSDVSSKQPNGASSALAAKLSRLVGPKSRKEAIIAAAMKQSTINSSEEPIIVSLRSAIPAIRNNETSITVVDETQTNQSNDQPKAAASRLSYSVPLETVVNDRILHSRPNNKCTWKNDTSDARVCSYPATGSVAEPTKTKTVATSVPEITGATTSSKGSLPNGVNPSLASRIYTSMQQPGPLTPSRTSSTLPNALGASQNPQASSFAGGRANNVAQNNYTGHPGVTSANATRSFNLPPPSVNGRAISTNAHLRKSVSIDKERDTCTTSVERNPHASPKNCDGDAGSGSDVQPTSCVATDAAFERTVAPTDIRQPVAATNNRDCSNTDKNSGDENDVRNDANFTSQKNDPAERSTAADRGDSPHRIGLINKMINLRDLKFTVCGSNIVKMTLYDTYRVNINVERGNTRKRRTSETRNLPGKQYSDSLVDGTNRCSITREGDTPRTAINDSKARTSCLASFAVISAKNENELSNQCGNRLQSINVATAVSEPLTNDQSRSALSSRVQDELKENRDPVEPSPTNITNDATNLIDRRNKCHLRSVGTNSQTMQQFNERGAPAIGDEINRGSPRKVTNHEQSPHVTSPSRIPYNDWRENSCGVSRALLLFSDEETNSVRRNENALGRKLRTRSGCVNDNENGEFSDAAETAAKRAKYTSLEDLPKFQQREKLTTSNSRNENYATPTSHQFGDAENRKISNVSKNEKFNVNNTTRDRQWPSQMTRSSHSEKTSLCCKVSIDLVRIRSILNAKLNSPRPTECDQFHECTSSSGYNNKSRGNDVFHVESFHYRLPRKFRSLGNLTIDERTSSRRVSIAKTRRWRSAECLDGLSRQSRRDDGLHGFCRLTSTENMRRGYIRNARFFEKHDCVR